MSEYQKAIYAGTFDPFTNGHFHIMKRALKIFDEITILIAKSPSKTPLFSVEERLDMLKELFDKQKNVFVESWDGLVVDYAKDKKIYTLLRGLRPTGDFESEFQMASMNNKIFPEVETVFLMTEGQHYFISSSLVRELYSHDGDISPYVPNVINDWFKKKS